VADFVSEDDLLTFEGWLKYQAIDPNALTPEQLEMWRGYFGEMMERCNASPKVGLMKLRSVPGEQKYAVALQDGADLWLTLWVRCSPKGEIFIIFPRADAGQPHASYHVDGTLHQKSHDRKGIAQKRQPLTAAFKGSEHLGTYAGHGKGTGAVCDPNVFDGVIVVGPGVLGPVHGSVGVDLIEPGYEATWEQHIVPSYYFGEVEQRQVFRRAGGRPSMAITIQRS
jgi:hypothetical protein